MRSLDGEHLGSNRIKLGFGKSMQTNCVWVGGLGDNVQEKYLNLQFNQFGAITQVSVDRERGYALIFFEQVSYFGICLYLSCSCFVSCLMFKMLLFFDKITLISRC